MVKWSLSFCFTLVLCNHASVIFATTATCASPLNSSNDNISSNSRSAPLSPLAAYCEHVDLVYTWVNGSDPNHATNQKLHIPEEAFADRGLKHRFRDFGVRASTLKYSLRSAQKFAPWINHVWIVTADPSQVPAFLDVSHPNLTIIHHADIFTNPSCIPTFNSCAIEVNIHRIKGLSECYFYLNDDMLFTRTVKLEDVWDIESGLQFAVTNRQQVPTTTRGQDTWGVKLYKVGRMIQSRTRMLRQDIEKVGHHGWLFQKHLVQEVVELYRREVEDTSCQKWRTSRSLWLPLVYSNYLHWKYSAPRRQLRLAYRALQDSDVLDHGAQLRHDLQKALGISATLISSGSAAKYAPSQGQVGTKSSSKPFEWLCLNDVVTEVTPEIEQVLHESFEYAFPNPSRFEL